MIRNALGTILILLLHLSLASAQSESVTNLVYRAVGEPAFDYMQEIALKTSNYADKVGSKKSAKIGIRICSRERLEVAMLRSALPFPPIITALNGLDFKNDQIIVLRSEDCTSGMEPFVAAEIWLIGSSGQLPKYAEKYALNGITVTTISSTETNFIGRPDYLEHTNRLLRALRDDPSSYGVIFGLYLHNSAKMNAKLSSVSRYLTKHGVQRGRFNVELLKWRRASSVREINSEPKYPSFFIVKKTG